ncbi:hypothetical protein I3843_11G143800 [Carya illinoinensis]|nr:uncharacterized protein LOC122281547 [Carya illinoinensis]KAG7956835.1 hypothetical protein I3843_11G143800 [Carya illinoinensis]KAG7956836.1 hypothetical protein I3843_11G143800 [Carya illinoinensis]
MVVFLKVRSFFCTIQSKGLQTLNPFIPLSVFFHSEYSNHSESSGSSRPKIAHNNVAIFWDLDNKPPNSFPPYEAAAKLKAAASSFGDVRYMVAYANRHAFAYVPQVVREHRRERRKKSNPLKNRGLTKAVEPHLCRVCGRKFYTNEKLVNHFKQIHESEHIKRLNQIESARGARRVKLVAKYSMKMEKYKNASRGILNANLGYSLADELKRAGFWVRTVPDNPQEADAALKSHMVDMMDGRRVECMLLVSDDSDFVDVLKEAKLRCLRTVVVGDMNDGALKRVADVGFSWMEVLMGKAKKQAGSVLGKWRDRDVLKRLEWTYKSEVEKKVYAFEDDVEDIEDKGFEEIVRGRVDDNNIQEEDSSAWWELDSADVMVSSQSLKRLEWTYNPYSKHNIVNDSEDETEDICFEDCMQNEDSSTWSDPDSNPDAVSSQSCR